MKKSLAILLSLCIASSSIAQTRPGGTTGGTGNTGTTPRSTGGSGLTNFGSNGFGTGTTGLGTTGGTSSGFGQSSGGTFGQGFSFNGGLGLGASQMGMGMGMGRSGFGGMGMGMGGMGMGMGMGGMGMGMGGGGRGGANGRGGGAGGSQQQYQIRPTVKLGFDVAKPTGTQRTQQFTSTIARLPQPERFAGVNVKVEGRKAIASGKLVNKADAKVLKNLLLMEPGIYDVDISALTQESNALSPSDKATTSSQAVVEEVQAVPTPR